MNSSSPLQNPGDEPFHLPEGHEATFCVVMTTHNAATHINAQRIYEVCSTPLPPCPLVYTYLPVNGVGSGEVIGAGWYM